VILRFAAVAAAIALLSSTGAARSPYVRSGRAQAPPASGSTPLTDRLTAVLREAFVKRSPKANAVTILAVKKPYQGAPHVVVLAHAIREDRKFEGVFDDELFGLFVLNADLSAIEQTLALIPTPLWTDYEVHIESVDRENVTIKGAGMTNGAFPLRRTIRWYQASLRRE
jgi:hypothetical protein